MFILIEIHSDDVDTGCGIVNTYEKKELAQAVMQRLYLDAHDRNGDEPIEWEYLEEDEARAWWSDTVYDFYDWYIFEV